MAGSAPRAVKGAFMRHWFAIEAIPLYVLIGAAVGGAGWYTFRLSRGPNIQWSKSNPEPWNSVEQNENVKLTSVNQKFDRSWSRSK